MNIVSFRDTLERSTLAELEQVINWVERPWQPGRNDRLRAAFHGASRRPHRKARLVEAIERELTGMPPGDLAHVAHGLGHRGPDPTTYDLLRLVEGKLRSGRPSPLDLMPLLDAAVKTAGMLLGAYGHGARRPHRGRGGRRHHGRP